MSEHDGSDHSSLLSPVGGSSAAIGYSEEAMNIEVDVDIHQGGDGGGSGKKKKKKALSIEERARGLTGQEPKKQQGVLTAGGPPPGQHPYPPPGQSHYPPPGQPSYQPVAPHHPQGNPMSGIPPGSVQPHSTAPIALAPPQSGRPGAGQDFTVENAFVDPGLHAPLQPGEDPWMEAGSLKVLDNEDVILRRAGWLTDIFRAYVVVSYIMLTNRRIVIKQKSSILGFNLFTVEASFLYENLRHMTVQRVTNFRVLWGGLISILLAIAFFGLAAVLWIYVLIALVLLFGGIFAIYWFFLFYNSNTIVIDFSKDEMVGSWIVPKGKGAFTSKILILRIDHCFEVMYTIYDKAKTGFADHNA